MAPRTLALMKKSFRYSDSNFSPFGLSDIVLLSGHLIYKAWHAGAECGQKQIILQYRCTCAIGQGTSAVRDGQVESSKSYLGHQGKKVSAVETNAIVRCQSSAGCVVTDIIGLGRDTDLLVLRGKEKQQPPLHGVKEMTIWHSGAPTRRKRTDPASLTSRRRCALQRGTRLQSHALPLLLRGIPSPTAPHSLPSLRRRKAPTPVFPHPSSRLRSS